MEAQGGLLFLKELVATFERRSELPLLLLSFFVVIPPGIKRFFKLKISYVVTVNTVAVT